LPPLPTAETAPTPPASLPIRHRSPAVPPSKLLYVEMSLELLSAAFPEKLKS
jgi:hypothetical protein